MRVSLFLLAFLYCIAINAGTPHENDVLQHYARKMNVSDSALLIPELYTLVDEWIGTPYRYGRSDKKGTDCSGLVKNIFYSFGTVNLPRSASGLAKVVENKPISELKEGDLVFFNYRGRTNSHVGIYLQNGWFVHASTVNGVTLNNIHTVYYRKRFSKGGTLKSANLEDLIQLQITKNTNANLNLLTPKYINQLEFETSFSTTSFLKDITARR